MIGEILLLVNTISLVMKYLISYDSINFHTLKAICRVKIQYITYLQTISAIASSQKVDFTLCYR